MIDKIAQRRSVLNKIREMTNVSGIAAENFFNPQFQEVMNNVRSVDAAIRAIATGQQIEDADPDPSNMGDTRSLKDLLKSAKSNFNRREYMTAVAELGRFHKKFADIARQIAGLHNKVDEVHHQFLFQDLDEDHKKQLHDLKTRFAAEQFEQMVKEANVMDFFYNIGTKRGRALAFYEKRYPKEVGRLKKDTANLLGKSESLLTNLLGSLKEMATARATRNVDNYMKAASRVSGAYASYDGLFKDYYNTNVKGFLEKAPLPTAEKVDSKDLGNKEVPGTKEFPDLDLPAAKAPSIRTLPAEEDTTMNVRPDEIIDEKPETPTAVDLVNPKIPAAPAMPTNVGPIPPAPDTIPTPPRTDMESNPPLPETYKKMPPIMSHQNFYQSLEALAGESPTIISAYIKKYACGIQGSDPLVAIKLMQVAGSIKA